MKDKIEEKLKDMGERRALEYVRVFFKKYWNAGPAHEALIAMHCLEFVYDVLYTTLAPKQVHI